MEREPEEAAQMLRAAELEVAIVFEYDALNPAEFERFYEGSSCITSWTTRCSSRCPATIR